MKKLGLYLTLVVLGFVIGYLMQFKGISGQTILRDTTYIDTGSYHIQYIPQPYKIDSLIYKDSIIIIDSTKNIKIDTAHIIAEFLKVRHYSLDTNIAEVVLKIRQTIMMNKLSSMSIDVQNNRATKVKITDANKWLIGGQVGGNKEIFDMGVFIGRKKKNALYFWQYNAFSKAVYIGTAIYL